MKFSRNTMQKIVMASGAMNLFEPWYVSLTIPSTNSTSISIAVCSLPGTPLVARRATIERTSMKMKEMKRVKNMLSMWMDQNAPRPVSTERCVRWCLI